MRSIPESIRFNMLYDLIASTTFGLEAVVRREIQSLGYEVTKTEDSKVYFRGDERAIVRSNLRLRTAERIYLCLAEFDAKTFEELFQCVQGIPWEEYLPVDASFPVVGTSVKSTLHSVPSCQSIIKKGIVRRLGDFYVRDHFEETGSVYRIRFTILKDHVSIQLDTSGKGLHKRGYRTADVAAPMKETLAAALVSLSYWKEGVMRPESVREKNLPPRLLVDPCCGSGTILIEAAMMARGIAPGLNRHFAAEGFEWIPQEVWKEERKAAYAEIDYEAPLEIMGFDINAKALAIAKASAEEAGVGEDIRWSRMDMKKFRAEEDYGIIITNPPYGERIGEDKAIAAIHRKYGEILRDRPTWSLFVITTDDHLEDEVGRKADRRRKLYNGRLKTTYYQFHGERPHAKDAE